MRYSRVDSFKKRHGDPHAARSPIQASSNHRKSIHIDPHPSEREQKGVYTPSPSSSNPPSLSGTPLASSFDAPSAVPHQRDFNSQPRKASFARERLIHVEAPESNLYSHTRTLSNSGVASLSSEDRTGSRRAPSHAEEASPGKSFTPQLSIPVEFQGRGRSYCGVPLQFGDQNELRFDEGLYIGTLDVDGGMTGYGKAIWTSGDVYIGEWLNDQMHGRGCYVWADGDAYEGEYRHGMISGVGTMKDASGVYVGDWLNDLRHGFGKMKYKSGTVYEGQWKEGQRHGQGILIDVPHHTTYEGEFKKDLKNGRGVETNADGDVYSGAFCDGYPHGKGCYIWANGESFEGEFVRGKPILEATSSKDDSVKKKKISREHHPKRQDQTGDDSGLMDSRSSARSPQDHSKGVVEMVHVPRHNTEQSAQRVRDERSTASVGTTASLQSTSSPQHMSLGATNNSATELLTGAQSTTSHRIELELADVTAGEATGACMASSAYSYSNLSDEESYQEETSVRSELLEPLPPALLRQILLAGSAAVALDEEASQADEDPLDLVQSPSEGEIDGGSPVTSMGSSLAPTDAPAKSSYLPPPSTPQSKQSLLSPLHGTPFASPPAHASQSLLTSGWVGIGTSMQSGASRKSSLSSHLVVTNTSVAAEEKLRELSLRRHSSAHLSTPGSSPGASHMKQGAAHPSIRPRVFQLSDFERWEALHIIGRGSFGAVYKALLPESKAIVCCKVIELNAVKTSEELVRLRNEVNLMKLLCHPNVVQYYGSIEEKSTGLPGGRSKETPSSSRRFSANPPSSGSRSNSVVASTLNSRLLIFMEFVKGCSLNQVLQKFGTIPFETLRQWVLQMVSGVGYLHSRGIIHRDIKGANVLLSREGVVKLADFGCSKCVEEIEMELSSSPSGPTPKAKEAALNPQPCHTLVGTPYWMAPEVIRGDAEGYGFKSDIWSLGCTVVEMLTGKPPWPESSSMWTAVWKIANSTGLPTEIPPNLDPQLMSFLELCFQRDPKLRPTTDELLKHPFLAAAVDGKEVRSAPLPNVSITASNGSSMEDLG